MQYLELKRRLQDFLIFSLGDIRKLAPDFDLRRVSEWLARGWLKRVRRGFYIFGEAPLGDEAAWVVANKIYNPSYISYETALSRYGLIPEAVFGITSATTLKTQNFTTPIGHFIYHNLKPALFFGYHMESAGGHGYKLADLEKSLLDYLHAQPKLERLADFREARVNVEQLRAKLNRSRFLEYLARFKNKALTRRARNLLKFIDHVES